MFPPCECSGACGPSLHRGSHISICGGMLVSRAMLADELVNMLKIQSNAKGGSAAIRTAFSDVRAKVEDVVERFPEEQDLVVVWDFVCEGEA